MRVKIYSNEHNAWWKDNYFGYTNNESEAGIFEIEEVNKYYPYIDFDKRKEDYLVKFECLAYEELEKENQKLKKIIKDYCYIDNFDNGEIIRMCCESYDESNSKDFEYLKEVLEE